MKRLLGGFGILSALVGLLVLTGSAPAWAEDGVTDKEVVLGAGLDLTGVAAQGRRRHGDTRSERGEVQEIAVAVR